MTDKEIFYEMLWDCAQCQTTGLLGDTHRHCPTCGSAQDPKKRYFPQPGHEKQAKDHQFVGTDWSCAYCTSPNSAAAAHCTNCGAGQDGSKPVALVIDDAVVSAPAPAPTSAAPLSRHAGRWRWIVGAVLLVLIVLGVMFNSTKDTVATIEQRSWEREIQVEQLSRVAEAAWCDSMPGDAYAVTRSREQRTTKRIENGQDCHDERTDKGDGTFTKRQVCVPRYREEPVYDDRCHFQVNRWRTQRTFKASNENSPMPVWPSVALQAAHGAQGAIGPNVLGAQRAGPRLEKYTVKLASGGKSWSCDVPEALWKQLNEGTLTPVKIRMTGGADCSSLGRE